jgi:hypothetical protein
MFVQPLYHICFGKKINSSVLEFILIYRGIAYIFFPSSLPLLNEFWVGT